MLKLIAFLFALCLMPILKPIFSNVSGDTEVTYIFYARRVAEDVSATVIPCGNSYIVKCDTDIARKVKSQLGDIQGESIRIKNFSSKTYSDIISKYHDLVLFQEDIMDMHVLYCYDQSLPRFVVLEGLKVNVQIVIKEFDIEVGYPLILNGY